MINNFNNKNLKSFEDNFNSKGDLSFAMYFYFETTATTNNIFDPEQNKMFFVSYVLIVAFRPKLNLKKIDAFVKIQYERKNPFSWKNDKCVICKMLLKIHPLGPEIPDNKMSNGNLFIHFEHRFLRNIYPVN